MILLASGKSFQKFLARDSKFSMYFIPPWQPSRNQSFILSSASGNGPAGVIPQASKPKTRAKALTSVDEIMGSNIFSGGAKIVDGTMRAVGLPCKTPDPAVMNDEVGIICPLLSGDERHQVKFDLHGVRVFGEAEPLVDPDHVRIHANPGDPKGIAQDSIGCLPPHPGKFDEFFHRVWNFTPVFLDKDLRATGNVLGLILVKTGGMDLLLKGSQIGPRVVLGAPVFLKKRGGDPVYSFIGTLGGEDNGHKQFKGVRETERASPRPIGPPKPFQDFLDTPLLFLECLFHYFLFFRNFSISETGIVFTTSFSSSHPFLAIPAP